MRRHRTFLVLAVFVSVLGMTSCGGSKPATSPDNSPNATVHTAQPVRATPSASAKMICSTEAQTKADLLIAQHRRARAVGKASDARFAMGDGSKAAAFDRMKRKVAHSEAVGQVAPASRPAMDGRTQDALLAENAALRAQIAAAPRESVAQPRVAQPRRARKA